MNKVLTGWERKHSLCAKFVLLVWLLGGVAVSGRAAVSEITPVFQDNLSQFTGVAVSNPQLVVMPDLIRRRLSNAISGEESHMPDIILGMDILRHLHVYVAYKERKLYISPADAPSPPAAPPVPSTR